MVNYPISSPRANPPVNASYAPPSNNNTYHFPPPAASNPHTTFPTPHSNRVIHIHIRVHLTADPNSPEKTYKLMLRLRPNTMVDGFVWPSPRPGTSDLYNYVQPSQQQTLNVILVSSGLPSEILHTRVAWASEVVACGQNDVDTWLRESSRSFQRMRSLTDEAPERRLRFDEDSSSILGHFMHVRGDNARHWMFWLSGLTLWYPKNPQHRAGPGPNGDKPWVVGVEMW